MLNSGLELIRGVRHIQAAAPACLVACLLACLTCCVELMQVENAAALGYIHMT